MPAAIPAGVASTLAGFARGEQLESEQLGRLASAPGGQKFQDQVPNLRDASRAVGCLTRGLLVTILKVCGRIGTFLNIRHRLKRWREAIFSVGIYVFKDAFRVDEYSGFCLYDEIF
jgi:hypothetical protein